MEQDETEMVRGGMLHLRGEVTVPHNPRAATEHVVRGMIAGAIGMGLEITRRDSSSIAFRAVTLGALCTGMSSGWLRVDDSGADARVLYGLRVQTGLVFGVVLGILAGLFSTLLPLAAAPSGRATVALAIGLLVALAWSGWVLRRNRLRVETFLHNLRYAS
jgi:hypothetical protein